MDLRIKVIWLFLLVPCFLFGENLTVSANKWVTLTDMKNLTGISVTHDKSIAFCGSTGGLYVVDLNTNSVLRKYTNTDGLLSNNVTAVYTDTLNRVWIGCSDGSISILDYYKNSFTHIYDIKNSNEINRSINDFVQYKNFMYVATSYGIQKISLTNFTFIDAPYYQLGTYSIRTQVNTLAVHQDKLFAGTALGLAYARFISNFNNPSSWQNYNADPLGSKVISTLTFDGKLFAGSEFGFVYYDGTNFIPYPAPQFSNTKISDLLGVNGRLYFIANNGIYYSNSNNYSTVNLYRTGQVFTVINSGKNDSLLSGIQENGLSLFANSGYVNIFPNSPYRNSFDWISIDNDGAVWIASGRSDGGFYKYSDNFWTNYNTETYPAIGGNWFRRIVGGNGVTWALGFGGGPTMIKGNTIKNYNHSNSVLPGVPNSPNFIAIFGGAFDNNGRLWITLFDSENGIKLYSYRESDSTFLPYPGPSFIGNQSYQQVVIDNYNTKWIITSQGLYFFNENGTETQYGDDIFGFYTASEIGSGVVSVNGLLVDKNNEVWIATNNGIFIISNPLAAIQNPNNKPQPTQMRIISGNISVPFIENCISITNDILNQKWVGTKTNGVFHLSSDGSTQLDNFTTRNSPIVSNEIVSLAVSHKDGKAYLCSNFGISVVQTDAIGPLAEFDKILCMPNPYVIPNGNKVKIDGLVENSSVKILSISGDLMAEIETPGGKIASWDGKDKNGQLVPSGVYLVVGFTKDGGKVGTGKIVVIKK